MVEVSPHRPATEKPSAATRRTFSVKEQEHVPNPLPGNRPEISMDKRSPEAIKAKKVMKLELPNLWREKAEFLPDTVAFFKNTGIDPDRVNPKPLGEGLTNVVFSYLAPDGTNRVIKIARQVRKGFMSTGYEQDADNIALVRKYFGAYSVPTEIRQDPTTGKYLIVQDAVTGKAVADKTESAHVRAQLVDMARLNREMMRQTGNSLDFIGVPGGLTWLRHQFVRILTKKSEFQLSNILEQPDGKLKIIDEGLLRFKNVPPKQRAISEFGIFANRVIMRLYFGVDLLPKSG